MKTCIGKNCRQLNPQSFDAFGKDKNRKDGLNVYCRQCRSDKTKQFRLINPIPERDRNKKWRTNNPIAAQLCQQKYRNNNKEKEKLRGKKFREIYPEKGLRCRRSEEPIR